MNFDLTRYRPIESKAKDDKPSKPPAKNYFFNINRPKDLKVTYTGQNDISRIADKLFQELI